MGDVHRFASAPFERVQAHGGLGRIETTRVHEGDGAVRFIDLTSLPPGTSIGEHAHAGDEEIYVVIAGHGLMQLDGETVEVGPGDVIRNDPYGTHGLRNTGDLPLALVVIDCGRPPDTFGSPT
jgi:mannose-6-phosphate isomerase-like protein (cupin superfamily)